jgi:acid stress-induced BolA-like protein IbaG/YrbA
LQEKFPHARVNVGGDEAHIEATVISDVFNDKALLQRHRMIYNALGDKLCAAVHAFTMHAYTPEEAEQRNI